MTQDLGKLLTLAQAGEQMQWAGRTVRRRLAVHGIATIGTGKRARITLEDLHRLIEAERQWATVAAPGRFEVESLKGAGRGDSLGRRLGRAV
jgi:hypothetical protein